MRADVQEIFKMTPHDKQVMMFSATLSKDIRPICKKFMQDVRIFGYFQKLGVKHRVKLKLKKWMFSPWKFTWTTRQS